MDSFTLNSPILPSAPSKSKGTLYGAVAVTLVLVNVAQFCPVWSTVICAAPSCPLWHAPLALTRFPPVNVTGSRFGSAQSCARNVVPLLPTHADVPTRSWRKLALKLRCTLRTGLAPRVEGLSWRSAASLTQAAFTISPGDQCQRVMFLGLRQIEVECVYVCVHLHTVVAERQAFVSRHSTLFL